VKRRRTEEILLTQPNPTLKVILTLLIIGTFLAACVPAAQPTSAGIIPGDETTTAINPDTETTESSDTPAETEPPTRTATITATPDLRLNPEDWQEWPIVPVVSANAKIIYEAGLEMGTDPARFSKAGDCQNIPTYFLTVFDHPDQYTLGPDYEYLQEAIDHFSGSFSRESVATAGGMNVASVLSHYWANKDLCESGESPLACELRLNNPSIVLISMEESWGENNKVENYEKYMRLIIETVIESGAVPILATKADNLEGDHLINQAIARLAFEYDIPLWNFWAAVQPLPSHGLLEDGFHLTHGRNDFSESVNLKQAWPVRNLTALQVIDAVWRQLNDLPLLGD
jgi:hypothetical protein